MIRCIIRFLSGLLVWSLTAALLAIVFVPAFLDRIYYLGPVTGHYDGERFENPDGEISFPVPPGQTRGNLIYRFLLGRDDRAPWPESVRVSQSKPENRIPGRTMHATWVGHATVLVQAAGLNILTDPIWSDYASPFPGIGPKRVAPPGVAFEDLPRIDIVVVSHDHYDHMDLPTLRRLWERDRPLIVTSLGNDTILRGAGIPSRALDWGGTVVAGGARIHVLRNHHWSSRWGRDRNRALWSAFLIETGAGNIFFAGDTGMGDGQWPLEALKHGPVRLAIIPVGAFRFYAGQMFTSSHVGPEQSVQIFAKLGAAQGVPIHWGTFRLSSEARDTPPKMQQIYMRCSGLDPASFRPLAIGEQIGVPERALPDRTPTAGDLADCKPGSAALSALE